MNWKYFVQIEDAIALGELLVYLCLLNVLPTLVVGEHGRQGHGHRLHVVVECPSQCGHLIILHNDRDGARSCPIQEHIAGRGGRINSQLVRDEVRPEVNDLPDGCLRLLPIPDGQLAAVLHEDTRHVGGLVPAIKLELLHRVLRCSMH